MINEGSLEKLLVSEEGKETFLLYIFFHPEDSVSNAAARSTRLLRATTTTTTERNKATDNETENHKTNLTGQTKKSHCTQNN